MFQSVETVIVGQGRDGSIGKENDRVSGLVISNEAEWFLDNDGKTHYMIKQCIGHRKGSLELLTQEELPLLIITWAHVWPNILLLFGLANILPILYVEGAVPVGILFIRQWGSVSSWKMCW